MTDPSPVMIRGRRSPLDYLFFLRPVLLLPVWTIALLGTLTGVPSGGMSVWKWMVFFLHLTCLFGGVYILNQICDVASDRKNRKLFFLPEGIISIRGAWVFTVALDLAALLLSLAFGRDHLVITAAVMVLGIVYSAGPHPWKNHPWLGFLANAMGHGPLVFLLGRTAMLPSVASLWYSSVPYFLAVGAVYLATTVPDVLGDCATGKKTAAVVLGGRPVMIIASVLVVAAIAIAGVLRDNYLLAGAAAALPFFVWSAIRAGEAAAGAAKAGVGFLSVAAIVAYPLYLVLLIVGFLATRRFFRWRFGMTYPTFITGS